MRRRSIMRKVDDHLVSTSRRSWRTEMGSFLTEPIASSSLVVVGHPPRPLPSAMTFFSSLRRPSEARQALTRRRAAATASIDSAIAYSGSACSSLVSLRGSMNAGVMSSSGGRSVQCFSPVLTAMFTTCGKHLNIDELYSL